MAGAAPVPPAPEGAAPLELRVRGLRVEASDGGKDAASAILSCAALDVAPGEAVALAGPSGAGKTTLLYAVSGLARAAAGSVVWGGVDLAALGEARRDAFRRAHIGLVFQEFILFEELSPLANAALPASFAPASERAAIRTRARVALERLGAPLDRRDVSRLSGGERQRVALARALATAPAAVLADEPTASLDRATADRLLTDLLAETRDRGRTLIVASHDPQVLEAMDRVVPVVDRAVGEAGASGVSAVAIAAVGEGAAS